MINYADTIDSNLVVVTYAGTILQEGTSGPAAAAIPVVVDDSLQAKVKPSPGATS